MKPIETKLAKVLLQIKQIEEQLLKLEDALFNFGTLSPNHRQRVTENLVKIKDLLFMIRKKRLELNLIILEGKNDN